MVYITRPQIDTIEYAKKIKALEKNDIDVSVYFKTIARLIEEEGYNVITYERYLYKPESDEIGQFADFYVENYNLTGKDDSKFIKKLIELANEELDPNGEMLIDDAHFNIIGLTE